MISTMTSTNIRKLHVRSRREIRTKITTAYVHVVCCFCFCFHRSLKPSFKNCVPGLKTKLGGNIFLVNDIFNGYDYANSEMYKAFSRPKDCSSLTSLFLCCGKQKRNIFTLPFSGFVFSKISHAKIEGIGVFS